MAEANFTESQRRSKRVVRATVVRALLPATAPAFFIVTTIVGAVRWFSPVPFWDMWDGTLQFYVARLQGAHWSPFFEQANEHRIVLSKVLFWADYRFFGGLSYLLIFLNIVLMFCLWMSLCLAARALMGAHRRLAYLCCALVAVPCFSWLQSENINWGYQSPFYLAYLLPLVALLMMARWIHDRRNVWFVAATVCGVLSTVTMANGLLALPLLVLMLALSGESTRWRTATLLLVTVLTLAAWTYHYHTMPHAGAPFRIMVKFLLMFFGAPFGWLFHNEIVTMLVGATVISASIWLALQWGRRVTRDPSYLALALFVVYIGAAGAAATISRSNFGLGAALAGRYETSLMLLYSALLLLFVHLYRERVATLAVVGAISVFVPLMLFAAQLGTMDQSGPEIARERMQAALALDLGVDDRDTIGSVYPQHTAEQRAQIWRVVANAVRYNLSVFGSSELKTARALLGKPPVGLKECRGNIDAEAPVVSDTGHVRLSGWVFDEATKQVPKSAYIVSNGMVVGSVLTGIDRPDVQQSIDSKARHSGFQGYAVKADVHNYSIFCKGSFP
ncbi:hypothetical protein [Trinickia sp. EG282A]|uniref:hypothetical protein n=1 Tax=Trinickia sp. EG282A TaxID=3237013 RepID=UPI0034D2A7CC